MSLNQHFLNLGQALKERREDQGISLEQVADQTKINLPILQSIEEAQITSQLPDVYLRGFILSYAKVIGMDIKNIEKELKTLFPSKDKHNISGIIGTTPVMSSTEAFIEKDFHITPIVLALSILFILGFILVFTNITRFFKVESISRDELIISSEALNQKKIPPTFQDLNSKSKIKQNPSTLNKKFLAGGEPRFLEIIIKASEKVTVFYKIDKNKIKKIFLIKNQFQILKATKNIYIKTSDSDLISIFQDGKNLGVFGLGGDKSVTYLKKD